MKELSSYRKPTRLVFIAGDDPGQVPITKFGGAPWWPQFTPRPYCTFRHPMTFIAQFLLSDVPELSLIDNSLLSFHYCEQCTYDGRMSFGWTDPENRGYDVRLFEQPANLAVDRLGALSEPVVQAGAVRFFETLDFPSPDDMPRDIYDLVVAMTNDHDADKVTAIYANIGGTKVGGWPSWVQNAEWPSTLSGEDMLFIAQIDYVVGARASWGGGGYAYLFAGDPRERHRRAELSILTT